MVTYIAGPMTGIYDSNYPAFYNAELYLTEKRGEKVENPAINQLGEGGNWIKYMYLSIRQLLNCDAIYLLKGWENSAGARLEFDIACALKMKIEFQ